MSTDDPEAPLPIIQLDGLEYRAELSRRINADCYERTGMTLAHLRAILAALPEETRREVLRRAFGQQWIDDACEADSDRTLAMTDEELDAEIRADGEDPARVHKWGKATGRWIKMCAELSGKAREERSAHERTRAELAATKKRLAFFEERRFPVLDPPPSCPSRVPWSMLAPYEGAALTNHDQTLERLAERGGLGASEMVAVLRGECWRDRKFKTDEESAIELKRMLAEHEEQSRERKGKEG